MGSDTTERARRLAERLIQGRQTAAEGWHREGPDFWRARVWWANVRLERVAAIAKGAGGRP